MFKRRLNGGKKRVKKGRMVVFECIISEAQRKILVNALTEYCDHPDTSKAEDGAETLRDMLKDDLDPRVMNGLCY